MRSYIGKTNCRERVGGRTIVTLTCIVLAMTVLSGCRQGGTGGRGGTPGKPLRITINSWIGWAPLYIAQEKGFFKKHGTDLELIQVEDAGTRKSTMISGRVDGYASSVDNFALDAPSGVPGKIVLCFDESHGGDGIVAKRSIKTAADLKGKTVAFQPGLPGHFLLLHVLDEAGVSIDDLKKQEMDSDKAGAAFAAGKLDAAVTWEPWLSKAEQMEGGHKLITSDKLPGLIVDTLVFRDDVLLDYPNQVKGVIQAWFDALAYWKDQPKDAEKIMARAYKLSVGDLRTMASGVLFYDIDKNLQYFGQSNDGPILKVFDEASSYWMKSNLIKTKKTAKECIDPSFIRTLKQS